MPARQQNDDRRLYVSDVTTPPSREALVSRTSEAQTNDPWINASHARLLCNVAMKSVLVCLAPAPALSPGRSGAEAHAGGGAACASEEDGGGRGWEVWGGVVGAVFARWWCVSTMINFQRESKERRGGERRGGRRKGLTVKAGGLGGALPCACACWRCGCVACAWVWWRGVCGRAGLDVPEGEAEERGAVRFWGASVSEPVG